MFYTTFKTQIEILPRITIIYGKNYCKNVENNGFAIEWLWFGIFIKI